MRSLLLVVAVLAAMGCESDVNKLERLKTAASLHRLTILMYQQKLDSMGRANAASSPQADSARRALRAHQDSLDIVNRDYARLMK